MPQHPLALSKACNAESKLYIEDGLDGRAWLSPLQEVTWERWLQQAEGLVMLPGTERGAYDFTLQQQLEALHACKMERSIHRVTAKKQHMFRVRCLLSGSYRQPFMRPVSASQHKQKDVLMSMHHASSGALCRTACACPWPDCLP